MKNLIKFLKRIRFIFFFMVLQITCFVFISNGNSYQKTAIISTTNGISGWFYQKERDIKNYFLLKTINKTLINENIKLRKQILKNYNRISLNEILVSDTIYKLQYLYSPAQVIKNMTSSRSNIITLNVGKKDEIDREMGVITADGIVGFVKDVSENFCTVIPAMNKQFRVTAKSTKENLFGTFLWRDDDSFNTGTVEKVPNYMQLEKGDSLITTTFEGIFPEGELIGYVTDIKQEGGSNYKTLKIKMSNDFHNLGTVYVVKNILKEELESIQEGAQ